MNAEIYRRKLPRVAGLGTPLWVPQTSSGHPIPYRAKGVSIGDVGILTHDGAFDFLFNICHPAGHPIQCSQLPENFVPLALHEQDVHSRPGFNNDSYLISRGTSKISVDEGTNG